MALPQMAYRDGIRQGKQIQFGGYNHTLGARDGELYDMTNMSSDYYPLLSPRAPRYLCRTLEKPNGIFAYDGLFWVDGTGFFADGERVGDVEDSRKSFAAFGAYIIIMPDKAYYNRMTGEFGSLEAEAVCPAGTAVFRDGTFVEEKAELNTLYCARVDFSKMFRAGDAVEISGCTAEARNNQTIVVREISENGHELRFYENSFFSAKTEPKEVTIRRGVPDMDYICVNENRLWGCKGDEIYASKLGDPFNFRVYELATGSYTVQVASAGDFTGCASYLGYACFFKAEQIYKVYGDKPSNFQVMSSATQGVMDGAGTSPAIAGETMFYLSRTGVVAWAGGIPQSIAAPFGLEKYSSGVGGTDGTKYYISMRNAAGEWSLFVYDTRYGTWHREDATEAVGFAWNGALYCLMADGRLYAIGGSSGVPETAEREDAVQWSAEWADLYEYTTYSSQSSPIPENVATSKFILRLELDEGSEMRLEIQYDDEPWLEVAHLTAETKRSHYLPVIPRRADHYRLRMTGVGGCRIYSLTREYYAGSAIQNNNG